MKRSTIIILCVALALVILGAGCCFAAFCIGGTDIMKQHEYTQKTAEFNVGEISEIKFDGTSDNIRILPSEDGKIHISYYESDNHCYEIATVENVLSMKDNRGSAWYENISLSFFGNAISNKEVVINIPKEIRDIDIKTMSGNVFFYCGNEFSNANISSMSGDVELGNFSAENIKATTASGDINISGIVSVEAEFESTSGEVKVAKTVADTLKAKTVSGDIKLNDTIAKVKFSATSTSGDIDVVSANEFGSVMADSTSGDIDIDINSCAEAEIRSTSGDIEMRVNDIEKYRITTSTTSGKVYVDASAHGAKDIYAKTVSGDITIK